MSFLIVDAERVALQIGENTLGGDGEDALPIPRMSGLPPLAVIAVWPEQATTIRALASGAAVTVDGTPLGSGPREIRHGARIEASGVRIIFGDLRTIGTTASVEGITDHELALLSGIIPSEPTASTGGRLTWLRDGRTYDVPEEGLVIGRDPECDIVLTSAEVSRQHATIAPVLQGYIVTDGSANGLLVNGCRVDRGQVLGQRDVLRIADEEFRFEADPATFEPSPELRPASPLVSAEALPRERSLPTAGSPTGLQLLATLEIINEGTLKGTRFRIERPIAHIGRAEHNEVRLRDNSVSGSHASLLLRNGTWTVIELGSTNGTYVDGERVNGEWVLRGVCELRVGNIKMVFRPIGAPPQGTDSTRAIVGVPDDPPKSR